MYHNKDADWVSAWGCVFALCFITCAWAFWTAIAYACWNWVGVPLWGWPEISWFQAWLIAMGLSVFSGFIRVQVRQYNKS